MPDSDQKANTNAAGEVAQPTISYSYERIPLAIINRVPDCWGLGKTVRLDDS